MRSLRPVLIIASLAFALALTTSATANQTFHTMTASLSPLGAQPLQSGWVHDIHMNGNVNGAHEEYHVAGAIPNTTFQVEILFYQGAGCSDPFPSTIDTAEMTTNGAGAANADWTFPANHTSTVSTFSAIWELVGPDGPAYATTCQLVLIGGK